ncbi:aspartyl/asparaginyl beta-hydroxylase domain-containing protein [Sphingomonas sp. AOB5]|uniref:aspartyl/asparaginyl beta-hydroxylase domain-containing protein n=1 Tax=Sphingomonas sp. AOB5 TaxID=3034017 RepID=UPI0023F87917|nr:aspartyl/asparaginyl beta-hydroxylase domain-containing protein [Sphingomonas sp. AOB5]MDF7777034.1 aspartyl/asparaginyl beta-hydroxylase domain-containing protein [Sphingomonas sp. AOB5]
MATIISQTREAQFPDRVRLPLTFDPARLAADLAMFEGDDWIAHFVTQNYEGDWSALPLRAHAGATHPVMMIYSPPDATDFVDTPFLSRTPYFAEVLAAFRCPVTCVRLMRLTPGSTIKEHRDHDLAAEEGWARIHVPVTTNPGVEFFVNRQPVTMLPGEAWYLRLSDPHSAANHGDVDRVHLVIDLIADAWLTEMLKG